MNIKAPKAGETIKESFIRALVELVSRKIFGGKGILVAYKAGGIVISNTQVEHVSAPMWQPYNGE